MKYQFCPIVYFAFLFFDYCPSCCEGCWFCIGWWLQLLKLTLMHYVKYCKYLLLIICSIKYIINFNNSILYQIHTHNKLSTYVLIALFYFLNCHTCFHTLYWLNVMNIKRLAIEIFSRIAVSQCFLIFHFRYFKNLFSFCVFWCKRIKVCLSIIFVMIIIVSNWWECSTKVMSFW